MPLFSVIVAASIEKVWEHLIYKIEHPEAFVPGVSDVIILDRNDDFVLRQMTITMNNIASNVVEKITSTSYNVRFELIEHPKFEGYVDNEAIAFSENETQITFTMHWKDKETKVAFDNQEIIKKCCTKKQKFI